MVNKLYVLINVPRIFGGEIEIIELAISHRAWKMNHLIVNSGNFLEAISTSSYGNQLLTIKYLGCIVHYYEAHSESF